MLHSHSGDIFHLFFLLLFFSWICCILQIFVTKKYKNSLRFALLHVTPKCRRRSAWKQKRFYFFFHIYRYIYIFSFMYYKVFFFHIHLQNATALRLCVYFFLPPNVKLSHSLLFIRRGIIFFNLRHVLNIKNIKAKTKHKK